MNKEKLYRDNQKMIENMARKASRATGIDSDELICQGNLIFCECLEKYSQGQGEFSKYLSTSLYFGLYKFAKHESLCQEYYPIEEEIENTEKSYSAAHEKVLLATSFTIDYSEIVSATIQNLKPDCEYIRELVFNPEIKMNSKVYQSQRLTKRKIYGYLREQGWRHSRIETAFSEIKMALEV